MNDDKGKLPAFLFYPDAWLNDISLRRCTSGARGLWADMIAIMHRGEPYGHLQVNGVPIESKELSKITQNSQKNIKKWIRELTKQNVCGITKSGVIYSRRMVRDESKRLMDKRNGKLGGNPKITQRVNPPINPPVNPKLSYAKDVKGLDPSGLVPTAPSARNGTSDKNVPYEELRSAYNERRGNLPECRPLSNEARRKVMIRWRANPDIDYWQRVFQKAGASDFLTTCADFHWLFKNELNPEKTIAGNYDNERGSKYAPRVSVTTKPRVIEQVLTAEEEEDNRLAAEAALAEFHRRHPRPFKAEPAEEVKETVEDELPV